MTHRSLSRRQLLTAHQEVLTQAERIGRKFGGAAALFRCLNAHGFKISRTAVYRWFYSKERHGRDGLIPSSQMRKIISAAKLEGILLEPEDLDPRPTIVMLPRYERQRVQLENDSGMNSRAVLSTEKNEVPPDHEAPPMEGETIQEKIAREGREKGIR